MSLKKKLGAAVGAVLVSGALLTGAAFASGDAQSAPTKAEWIDKAVEAGKLTQGEADTLRQLQDLRHSYMEKFKTDAKTLIDQAVKDGKITQDQADRMIKHKASFHHGKGRKMHSMTEQEVKERLAEAVKKGKLTQEQADTMLKRWQEHHAKAPQ